ncbi:MAG: hypothetical protein NTY77_11665 [Elusimicrobia bacterium]|nr:hypothetical protein [Elusimicrobiota bacterium]
MDWHGVLDTDAEWSGEVSVDGDVLVPAGKTLRLTAGSTVNFAAKPAWSCAVFRSAPEGWPIEATRRELCDLVVQGRLEILGTEAAPVSLGRPEESWGGISLLGQGRGLLKHARLQGARETSLQVFDEARLECEHCVLQGSEKGLWTWGFSRVRFSGGEFAAGRWGAICCDASQVRLERVLFRGGEQGCSASGWSMVDLVGCKFEGQTDSTVYALDHGWMRLEDCVLPTPPLRRDQARIDASVERGAMV